MAFDIFATTRLNRLVEYLDRPASHLLDAYFPMVQEEDTEEIHFDKKAGAPRITPFVAPFVEGIVVDDQGYTTDVFKPAYAKDKRRFMPNQPLRRLAGEQVGGNLTPIERREMQVSMTLADQLDMLTRREEVMVSEALRTGQITVVGEKYPSTVVNFSRDAALTVTLLTTARWGESGVVPLDDIETWTALIQEKSGAVSTTVTMDPEAWKLFKASLGAEKLDYRRGTNITINTDIVAFGQGNEKARYKGSMGEFDFWVYQDRYVNDAGSVTKMIPDNTVIIGGPQIEGTRAYGCIQDEKAGYQATRFFSKSWLEEDPAIRWLLLQSAPLPVPYRVNASFCATVR
ncbi:MAG: major capsid protein [Woeseia sp.]|nr:major capsid protein [Woeseia sp.]